MPHDEIAKQKRAQILKNKKNLQQEKVILFCNGKRNSDSKIQNYQRIGRLSLENRGKKFHIFFVFFCL